MTDLSKWDYAAEFMLYEAAALIVGIDPAKIYTETEPAHDNPRIFDYHEHPLIKPVVVRMKHDFFDAGDLYLAMHKGHWHHAHGEPLPELVLRSRAMEIIPLEIGSKLLPLSPATLNALKTWLDSGDSMNYETCTFARAELARWLAVNRLASVYTFAQNATSQSQERNRTIPVEKPLSNRERETLLTIIGALCEDAGYDYTKHAKTAGLIQSTAAKMGVSIGETTIEGHLKKIPDALGTRMK